MQDFNDNNNILNKNSNNKWLLSLQKACKNFYESFLNNELIKSISSNEFDKQFFEQWSRQRFRQFFNQHKDITEEQI